MHGVRTGVPRIISGKMRNVFKYTFIRRSEIDEKVVFGTAFMVFFFGIEVFVFVEKKKKNHQTFIRFLGTMEIVGSEQRCGVG